VGDRFVTRIKLLDPDLLVKKNGDPWDSDGSGPDFYFNISSGAGSYATKPINNVTTAMLPVEWKIDGGWPLTKDKWTWSLRDVVEGSTYQPIGSWQFKGAGYTMDGTLSPFKLAYVKSTSVEIYWEIR
jgi:hypothetical protein